MRRIETRDQRAGGFTLIELVVVIAIIATLTALATFNFNQARTRARDVQRKSELKQIQNALELYKNDRIPQTYPTTASGLTELVTGNYMAKLPVDPKVKAGATWDNYTYNRVDNLHYTLTACIENTSDPDATVTSCQAGAGVVYQLVQP